MSRSRQPAAMLAIPAVMPCSAIQAACRSRRCSSGSLIARTDITHSVASTMSSASPGNAEPTRAGASTANTAAPPVTAESALVTAAVKSGCDSLKRAPTSVPAKKNLP